MEYFDQYSNHFVFVIIVGLFLFKGKILGLFFKFKNVNAAEASIILKNGNSVLLDVRTVGECKSGKVSASVNIPLAELSSKMDSFLKDHKDKEVLVICASGSRSVFAAVQLVKKGVKAYNVTGGMVGWSMRGDRALLVK